MLQISTGENLRTTDKMNLYKNIFGAAPWNEGYICGMCESVYPKDFYGKCSCGEIDNFIPFYKNKELKNNFVLQQLQQGYQESIANICDEMVGFIWGWETDIQTLNQEKFCVSENELSQLEQNIKNIFPDFNPGNFYYFAEIGVKNEYRGQDIAGKLYRENMENARQAGNEYCVVRTTRKSDVPYLWFKKEGFRDVFFYEDEQDRVILVIKLGQKYTLGEKYEILKDIKKRKDIPEGFCMEYWEELWEIKDLEERKIQIDRFQDLLTNIYENDE